MVDLWVSFIVGPKETRIGNGVPDWIAYRTREGALAGLKGHFGRIVSSEDDRIVFQLFTRSDLIDQPSDTYVVIERQVVSCSAKWDDLRNHASKT